MIKREQKAFYRYYYHTDQLEEVIPQEFQRKGKLFRKVDEYKDKDGEVKFVLYEHNYGNGRFFECFDKYDLKVFARYG